mgnify:CR=1 FL=1
MVERMEPETSLFSQKLIIFLSYGIIILRIAARGTYIYFRTEVGIRRRRKVCGNRTYGDAFGVSSRKTGGSSIFVARCKHGDAAVYHSVRRACIVDEVVQNFFLPADKYRPILFSVAGPGVYPSTSFASAEL